MSENKFREKLMGENEATPTLLNTETETAPSQADLYEDLKRIGELEDQKRELQSEIDVRTAHLRKAIIHLERSSLLYKMLSSALGSSAKTTPAKTAPANSRASKKTDSGSTTRRVKKKTTSN